MRPDSLGMGILFYPRGGSAQVVRYLSRALTDADLPVRLATGSLGEPGEATNAATFYDRADLQVGDYSDAAERFERGEDPLAGPRPFHPSYEDRPAVPDRAFDRLTVEQAELQVRAWSEVLADGDWLGADLHHLHHLTPLHLALLELDADARFVTQLHGTELKFLERVQSGAATGPTATWWFDRLGAAARRSRRLICVSDQDADLAKDLLGATDDRLVVVPNGVDTTIFDRIGVTSDEHLAHWKRWLVDDPQGWDESGRPGSIAYSPADLAPFVDTDGKPAPVVLFVGRFLDFKRVPLLIRAYALARPRLDPPAPLVIWGGAPGEWEGEHPARVAADEGVAESVFFVGWRGHEELPTGLACADVLAAPSVDEPFGQVYLEAMSAGLPVICTATGGPLGFVNTDPEALNGWMVPPDDVETLAAAIVLAINDKPIRRRRGNNAYKLVRERYSWESIATRYLDVYEDATGDR